MIRFADESMREALRQLWHECFGDNNDYVDLYFAQHDIARHTMVFIDGETPVSMLSLLPMTVVTRAGILPARYIYAVATKASHRGRGIKDARSRPQTYAAGGPETFGARPCERAAL